MSSFKYEVYEKYPQRIALVSFRRAASGAPKLDHPDIDNRGYFGTTGQGIFRGPIVGVTVGDTVIIEMKRERISENAELFVTSSDPQVMSVTNMVGTDTLPYSTTTRLKITGKTGSGDVAPKTAEILIQYGDKKVVIGAMSVWVFSKLEVALTVHKVTIENTAGESKSPSIDIGAALEVAKAVWQPCGISFTLLGQPQSTTRTFLKAGTVLSPYAREKRNEADLERHRNSEAIFLFSGEERKAKSINVYFVNKIVKTVEDKFIIEGYTLNPTKAFKISAKPHKDGITVPRGFKPSVKPGIAISTEGKNTILLGQILAHEIGHYLGLRHIDSKESADALEDSWSKRMLMFPTGNFGIAVSGVSDVGYGRKLAGALITLKDLSDINDSKNHSTDGEWLLARATIKKGTGLYEFADLDEFTE